MDDASSLHSDSELNSERQSLTDSEPIKKPPTRRIARKRPTHVKLQNQSLRTIPNMESRKDSFVVYLYHNKIDRITNLDILTKLTHLYLSQNNIRRLENMDKLVHLEKLYISHNKISVLEGLENLRRLRELHMEFQRRPDGDALTFDPRSIQAVRGTLHVLNIDGNGVTSLQPLTPLSYVTDLCCADNQLQSLVDLCESVRQLPCLARLDLKGNPLCELQRHRDAVVENAPELRKLDDLDVTASFRKFVCGRGQAASRRLSVTQQQTVVPSASDDVIVRDLCGAGLRPPQVALSQGSLPQLRRASVTGQPVNLASQSRRASSTHLRVGNMLTLTPQQRALVRTAAESRAASDAQLATPGGDPWQVETSGGDPWQSTGGPGRRDTLPSSPARRPRGADARSARPSVSQPYALAEPSSGEVRKRTGWLAGEGAVSGSLEKTQLRQTMSEEMPNRMAMLSIMP